ncbi:hypothetical protein J8273_0672 [Carpediemonas membranifera]|uniref:Uncharacterized protein n=1 Tax=Carpediemonas membranifera TaxID=201153 RepID=A0A8J6BHF7_9EUKA|nr:hypothetical protein J8273_0672 [Carpediemonas membranifera]|eukprot:KAG9397542.1 hypothetical protein J8273_0672 [Carpediemonas membranifera]
MRYTLFILIVIIIIPLLVSVSTYYVVNSPPESREVLMRVLGAIFAGLGHNSGLQMTKSSNNTVFTSDYSKTKHSCALSTEKAIARALAHEAGRHICDRATQHIFSVSQAITIAKSGCKLTSEDRTQIDEHVRAIINGTDMDTGLVGVHAAIEDGRPVLWSAEPRGILACRVRALLSNNALVVLVLGLGLFALSLAIRKRRERTGRLAALGLIIQTILSTHTSGLPPAKIVEIIEQRGVRVGQGDMDAVCSLLLSEGRIECVGVRGAIVWRRLT